MRRRMFFGALAAAFCQIPVAAKAAPLSHFEQLRQFFMNAVGRYEGYRFRDPGPPYMTRVVRTQGRLIWASPKRSIHSTGIVTGPTYRSRLGEWVELP